MWRFEKEPLSEECINLMTAIFRYAVECNSTETTQELTGDKPTFFVYFSGHVSEMQVHIHKNGYDQQADEIPIYFLDSAARVGKTDDEYRRELKSVLESMHAIYETWALNDRIKR